MAEQAEFLAALFPNTVTAEASLRQLQTMEKSGAVKVLDAAVITKQPDGKLKIDEIKELTPKKGRRRGAIVGGIFGVVFPPSLIVSAIVGGVAGGLLGRFTDQGMENDQLKAIGDEMLPGSSAIVAIVEDVWAEKFVAAVDGYTQLERIALDADATVAIIAASEDDV